MKKYLLIPFAICLLFTSCLSTGTESNNQNYIGWVDGNTKDVVVEKGMIQLKAKPNLGSFTIGVKNQDNKLVPVLASANEFTSNVMYLKMSKKTYHLIGDNTIKTSAIKNENGLTINYKNPGVFEVKQNFSFLKTSEDIKYEDLLKVEIRVTNIGTKRDDFAFKMILDTVLGEHGAYHFYNSDGLPVKSEVMYRTMQNQKWIESKNMNASMKTMFYGADITAPEIVALANYSTVEKGNWEPDMLSYRSFDTVMAYNNSSLCAIWPNTKLAPNESKTIVYYIAFATDGESADADKYIAEYTKVNGVPKELLAETTVGETEIPPVEAETVVEEVQKAQPVDFDVNGLTKQQYSPEYIQSLLDRIAYLESNPSTVNRQELLRLNEELDLILSALR